MFNPVGQTHKAEYTMRISDIPNSTRRQQRANAFIDWMFFNMQFNKIIRYYYVHAIQI